MNPLLIRLFLAGILTVVAGCKKEQTLPEATQVGAGIFGCKVNGARWVAEPTHVSGGPTNPPVEARLGRNGKLEIWAHRNSSNGGQSISFLLRGIRKAGAYPFQLTRTSSIIGGYSDGNAQYAINYENDSLPKGELNLTRFDTVANVVAGTFNFKAGGITYSGPPSLVTVTAGRFDVKLTR